MTNIDKYLERFEAYYNGELTQQEEEAFKNTLANDPDMKLAWKEYKALMDALSDKEAVSLRLKLEDTFYKHQGGKIRRLSHSLWFRLSAAAVILVIMGTICYFFCSSKFEQDNFTNESNISITDSTDMIINDSQEDITAHHADTQKEELEVEDKNTQQIASIYEQEIYQISPVFAELLNNVYRSNWFKLRSPKDSVIFSSSDSIEFNWETNIEEALYFDILDRNGKVIYKHKEPITSPWTFCPDLDPAIYMFRFATMEEPVWLGVMVRR